MIPFALIVAAGVSALGAAFGVWALLSALVLLPAIVAALRDGGGARGRALVMLVVGVLVVLLAALPVWTSAGGSVQVAEGIASTSNPGNLVHALRAIQLFGIWLAGSYKLEPTGASSGLTHGLALLALAGALLGVWQLWRLRALALLAWFGLMLLACLIVVESVSVWGGAKTLMLSSPAVVLLAWAGVGALIGPAAAGPGAGVLGGARPGPDGGRAGVGREAVPRLEPRSHKPLRRARAPELALRGAWPDPVHRLRRILAVRAAGPRRGGSRFRVSAARRRVSGGRPRTPGAARSAGAVRAGCVPADHQPAGPAREPARRPPTGWPGRGPTTRPGNGRPGAPVAARHVALRGDAARQCARLGRLARSPPGRRCSDVDGGPGAGGRAGAAAAQPASAALAPGARRARARLGRASAQHRLDPDRRACGACG